MATQKLLTKQQTADFFSINVRTLDRWSKRGVLNRIKIGGTIYYRYEDLKELITPNTSEDE